MLSSQIGCKMLHFSYLYISCCPLCVSKIRGFYMKKCSQDYLSLELPTLEMNDFCQQKKIICRQKSFTDNLLSRKKIEIKIMLEKRKKKINQVAMKLMKPNIAYSHVSLETLVSKNMVELFLQNLDHFSVHSHIVH